MEESESQKSKCAFKKVGPIYTDCGELTGKQKWKRPYTGSSWESLAVSIFSGYHAAILKGLQSLIVEAVGEERGAQAPIREPFV